MNRKVKQKVSLTAMSCRGDVVKGKTARKSEGGRGWHLTALNSVLACLSLSLAGGVASV